MKKFINVSLLALAALGSVSAFADVVSGVLVDARRTDGYIQIMTLNHGVFAFDDSQISPALMRRVEACLNKHTVATYNDEGMIGVLVSVRCN